MPARMINNESTVAYNNKLKQAAPGMKLGVNNDVNPGTKKAGPQLMEGGQSKINPPNSHHQDLRHKNMYVLICLQTRRGKLKRN